MKRLFMKSDLTARLPFLLITVILTLGSNLFANPYSRDSWYNEISLYSWLPGQSGSIIIDGNVYEADLVLDKLIRDVNWSLNLAYEGGYDLWMIRWTGAFSRSFDLSDVRDVETALSLTDVTIGFMPWWERFYIIAGGRYFGLDAQVVNKTENEIDKVDKQKSWFDLFAGVRYELPVNNRFSIYLRSDIGGFGSKLSWNTSAAARWSISNFALEAAYRTWGVDYQKGRDNNLFKWDVVTTGPGLGMTFYF